MFFTLFNTLYLKKMIWIEYQTPHMLVLLGSNVSIFFNAKRYWDACRLSQVLKLEEDTKTRTFDLHAYDNAPNISKASNLPIPTKRDKKINRLSLLDQLVSNFGFRCFFIYSLDDRI